MNRAYQNMLTVAKDRLKEKDPNEIAKKANVIYDDKNQQYLIQSLGKKLVITYPDYECTEKLDNWYHLVLLHYLDLADGTALSENLISFASLKDGIVRGTKFDRTIERELQRILKDQDETRIEAALKALGGINKKSRADLCLEIPFLPMYPLTVNIWFADDEYPASGRILLNECADHYLTVEDAVTVGELFINKLSVIL